MANAFYEMSGWVSCICKIGYDPKTGCRERIVGCTEDNKRKCQTECKEVDQSALDAFTGSDGYRRPDLEEVEYYKCEPCAEYARRVGILYQDTVGLEDEYTHDPGVSCKSKFPVIHFIPHLSVAKIDSV